MTCFVVAYSVVSYWHHAERGFAKADRTYVMTTRIQLSDGSDTGPNPRLDPDFYEKLKLAFPEFETIARARAAGVVSVTAGDAKTRLFGSYADTEFLEIFDLPFITGDPTTALSEPNSAVITDATARRLFGSDDAIGRTLRYAGILDLTVAGVIDAIPQPSHIGPAPSALLRFDVLASWDALDRVMAARRGQFQRAFPTARLRRAARKQPFDAGVARSAARADRRAGCRAGSRALHGRDDADPRGDGEPARFRLFAGTNVSVSVSTLLLLLGTVVLGIACVNYVNLATAQALRRANEVGLRRAIGADTRQIVAQHLLEAALMTGAAFVLAVAASAIRTSLRSSRPRTCAVRASRRAPIR